jgi:hypothetical protein
MRQAWSSPSFSLGDKTRQRLRQLGDQNLARGNGKIVTRQRQFAHGGEMAVAFDDTIDRERRNVGIVVLQQRQAGFLGADFGDRGGDRTRQRGAARDRGLHRRRAGRHGIDQIGIDEQRRERQHGRRDVRVVGGQRQHDGRRRARARRECVGERPAHQRRGIVEQHQHRAFGGAEIVGRKIGVEIGAGQCACCFGPLVGRRGAYPIEKIADDHCSLARSSVLLATKASTTLADSWRGGIPKSVFL